MLHSEQLWKIEMMRAELFAIQLNKDKLSLRVIDWIGLLAVHYKRLRFYNLGVSICDTSPLLHPALPTSIMCSGSGLGTGRETDIIMKFMLLAISEKQSPFSLLWVSHVFCQHT